MQAGKLDHRRMSCCATGSTGRWSTALGHIRRTDPDADRHARRSAAGGDPLRGDRERRVGSAGPGQRGQRHARAPGRRLQTLPPERAAAGHGPASRLAPRGEPCSTGTTPRPAASNRSMCGTRSARRRPPLSAGLAAYTGSLDSATVTGLVRGSATTRSRSSQTGVDPRGLRCGHRRSCAGRQPTLAATPDGPRLPGRDVVTATVRTLDAAPVAGRTVGSTAGGPARDRVHAARHGADRCQRSGDARRRTRHRNSDFYAVDVGGAGADGLDRDHRHPGAVPGLLQRRQHGYRRPRAAACTSAAW